MFVVRSLIALAIFSIMIYGCGKKASDVSYVDSLAYENLRKIDVQLADSVRDDVSYEEDFNKKIIPIAEHVSIQQDLSQMDWRDIDDDASTQAEMLVLENIDDNTEKMVIVSSKETRMIHLFLVRNYSGTLAIEAHSVLSLSINNPKYRCHLNSNGKFEIVDDDKNIRPCAVSESLLSKTMVLRTLLRENLPETHKSSSLSHAIGAKVKIFEDRNRRLFLLSEGGVYSLLSEISKTYSPKVNFIGFFESGYF